VRFPVVALVPVNRLDRAKGRLAGLLSPGERMDLTRATLLTALDALEGADIPAFVLTADERARAIVGARAEVLDEDAALRGLNPQLEAALAALRTQLGDTAVLIVHADLPLATSDSLTRVIEAAAEEPSVTLVESGDGGTNVMLLRPPGLFPLSYGLGSARRHRAAAHALTVRVVDEPDLALDLDTEDDVRRLLATERGRTSHAGRVLEALGVRGRLGLTADG
jgi:2-phospho-L-lactate guanylyltransferase